jgi:leader peptidase (prepilin peptidase)/N-methyltransferase
VTDLYPVTALITGLAGVAAGGLVPRMIAGLPEPEPEPDPAEQDTDLAALADHHAEHAEHPEHPEHPEHSKPAGREPMQAEVPKQPEEPRRPEEPKELYADIAARPGLALRAAVASGVCAAALGLVFGWNLSLLVVLPLVPVGVALAVVDWRTKLLPTRLIAPSYVVTIVMILLVWLVDSRAPHDLERTALGWLVYGGMFFLLWFIYPRGLGYGDVRLAGLLGLALGWVGWAELLLGIWAGLLLGGILGGLLSLVLRRRDYPFGPFMLVGALLGVVLGQPVVSALYG